MKVDTAPFPYEEIPASGSVGSKNDRYRQSALATNASWAVNWFLFFIKLYVFIVSSSKAIAAALVDSAVDLISQLVLQSAESRVQEPDVNYPIGRSRLEALGVLGCAAVMTMASFEVVQFSFLDLYDGFVNNDINELCGGYGMYGILVVGTVMKLALYIYCTSVNKTLKLDTLDALAEDHLNDVISNTMAIITAAIAMEYPRIWYIDPCGAIVISAVIIYRWVDVINEQIRKIVGHTAPIEFVEDMNKMALAHDSRIAVDVTRAYHFGSAFNVEMEIILPGSMTVCESHDIALALQHRIEESDLVERAFVHVDYAVRDGLEHKIERNLHGTGTPPKSEETMKCGFT